MHLLHLDVAVYYYFVQLYTMYPCNFMDYLKARYGPKGEVHLFKRHIAVSSKSMLVPLHHVLFDNTATAEACQDAP